MSHRRFDYAALLLNLLQLVVDLGACLAGFAMGFWLYKYTDILRDIKMNPHTPIGHDYYLIASAFAVVVLISFTVKHLYQSRETGLMNMDEATGVLQGLFFAAALTISGSYFLLKPTGEISRLIVGLGIFLSCICVLLGRALCFKARRYLQSRGHFFRRVIICGAGEAGRTIARKMLHSPKFHILPVAFLDDTAPLNSEVECLSGHDPLPVAGTTAEITETLDRFDAQEIWIAMPGADQNQIIDPAGDAARGQHGRRAAAVDQAARDRAADPIQQTRVRCGLFADRAGDEPAAMAAADLADQVQFARAGLLQTAAHRPGRPPLYDVQVPHDAYRRARVRPDAQA
jgi:FlaA1/EpsC-like NDP-sugar epimerase